MIDGNKLQYYTMAAWMRGYAAGLDEYQDKELVHKLLKAAQMLDAVFAKYQEDVFPEESKDETK